MSTQPTETEEKLKEETLLSHLVELRSRLLKAGASILVVFLVLVPFSDFIFSSIALPLMEQLPEGSTMIATQVASPFLTPFKTTMFAALFLSMPVVLYQIWGFAAPGLYKKEKKFAVPLLFVQHRLVLLWNGVCLLGCFSLNVCFFHLRRTRWGCCDDRHRKLPGFCVGSFLCLWACF